MTPSPASLDYPEHSPEDQPLLLGDMIERAMAHATGHLAIVDGDCRMDYRTLGDYVMRGVAALKSAGIGKGDRVGYLGLNSPNYVILMLAAFRIGAVTVAVNWRLVEREIAYIVGDAGIELLVSEVERLPVIGNAVRQIVLVDATHDGRPPFRGWISRFEPDDTVADLAPDDVAVQLYTSGTTGHPKGALLTHGSLSAALSQGRLAGQTWSSWSDQDVALVAMPQFHIGGTAWTLQAMNAGGTAILLGKAEIADIIEAIERHRITKMFAVPAVLNMILNHPLAATADLSSLRALLYGASPIPLDILKRSMKLFPNASFVQMYGATETSGTIVYLPPEDHDIEGTPRMAGCGRPYPQVELRVVDERGQDLPPGKVGEILIRSPMVMKGYHNLPEATAAAFDDDWFRSGDAGSLDADGYLYLFDRVKDMICSGAENIYPAEVENALHEHPDIVDCAVIGVPDAAARSTEGPDMAEHFPPHPYLHGHHAPNRFEADAPDLVIEGRIPDDLAGVFYRNGPEPLHPTRGDEYHWFDGDGMVYAFFIEDGRVSMRNRWVRTDKFEMEKAAGKRLFGVFGNPMMSDPSVAGKRYNTANTNIIVHGGKLLALMEGAPAVEIDPRSLDTIGEEHYSGTITTTFSAHPKLDHRTGELINIGMAINGPMGAAELRYDIIGADGQPRKQEIIPLPHMSLMHTFLLTENWVVFPVLPIDTDIGRAMRGGPMAAWVNGRPSKLALMPREGNAADIRWFEFDPRHMFHELNAWEEDGKIIADVATANGTALFPDETGARGTHKDTQQSLRRWTIDPLANSNVMKEETLNERDIQFPRPDDRMMTRKTRHSFANINLKSRDGRVEGMDAAIRFDTETGKEDIHHFGNGASSGELVFAPRIGAKGEGDGYAVTLVHPANSATSELVIFDALDIAAGPVARVLIPFRVPSSFHCNFYPADGDLYRGALH